MSRGISLDGYFVEWDPANRKIVITPAGSTHASFGLGNAVVNVNFDSPPTKLIKKIDSDPDLDIAKLAAQVDYSVPALLQPATGMAKKSVYLRLSSSGAKRMSYYSGAIEQWGVAPRNAKVNGCLWWAPPCGYKIFW